MPIRFECVHCGRRLGIGRRKAGAVVKCPSCGKPLQVPSPSGEGETTPSPREDTVPRPMTPAPAPANAPLFERSDFEELLRPPALRPAGESSGSRRAAGAVAAPSPGRSPGSEPPPALPRPHVFTLDPLPAVPPPAPLPLPGADVELPSGIYLSPARATGLCVLLVVLLAVAFGLGMLVGRSLG